jgi:hypothetical protein
MAAGDLLVQHLPSGKTLRLRPVAALGCVHPQETQPCAASRRWQHRTQAVFGVRDSAVRAELPASRAPPVRRSVLLG